jgi:hypothetical protein
MRTFAQVRPSFWHGATGRQIRRFGHECQVLALYLITGPSAHAPGLYYLPLTAVAHETGMTVEEVRSGIAKLCEIEFCSYDHDSEVVFVMNMARFQIGERLEQKDKNVTWVWREMKKMRDLPFFDQLLEMYGQRYQLTEYFKSDETSKPLRSIETESGDLEIERNDETKNGNGHTNGGGVTRGHPERQGKATLQVVERADLSHDEATLKAQRTLEDRRAMSKKLSR